jgi:hypothetical protein
MFIFYIALFLWPFAAPGVWSLVIGQIVLTIIIFVHQSEYDRNASFFAWLVGGIIPFLIAFGFLSALYPINTPIRESRTVVAEEVPILSLSNEATVSGSFVLGTGAVRTGASYLSKRQTSDGGFETFIIEGKTTVYEDVENQDQASLIVYEEQIRLKRTNLPSWVLYLIREERIEPWTAERRFNHIHVPTGTVTRVLQI